MASSWARCRGLAFMPRRLMAPAMCIRQPESQDTRASAPVASMLRSLSSRMASEIYGYLTEKLPPKQQHSLVPSRGTKRAPLTSSISNRGSFVTSSSRSRWQEA